MAGGSRGPGPRALVLIALLAAPRARADGPRPWLVDVAEQAGVRFRHHAARSAAWLYPETFGAGVALLDVDGDGRLDILLLDTGSPPGAAATVAPASALYLNRTAGPGAPLRFVPGPVPDLSGMAAMGACVGDVDGDGDDDVYVTGLPAGRLLLSDHGRLVPAPGNGGIDDPGWSSSCTWLDADGDGRLDLFSGHYVRWSAATEQACGGEKAGFRSYCPPDRYEAEPPRLFLGIGGGRFRDATAASGVTAAGGKDLGVVAADLDGDGHADLYVANDQRPNALLLGDGTGRFREAGLLAGVALSEEGKARAGMGVDAADARGDGTLALTVTNLDLEANALFEATGRSGGLTRYRDDAARAGLAEPTLMMLGFGTAFADLDLDGDQDLFVANGHILPNIAVLRPGQTAAMDCQLFENVTPHALTSAGEASLFRDARARWLPAAARPAAWRGLAVGDLDDDGDADLVVTANDGPARILRNDTATPSHPARFLGVILQATTSAPGAPCASATLDAGDGWTRLVLRRTGGSYASASDTRLVFGLGDAPPTPRKHAVVVTWPGGRRERFDALAEGAYHRLREGSGAR